MPVIPAVPASPYPLVSKIMDLARVRVNDTMNDLSGDLLANTAPYTPVLLNTAWQWLQSKWAQSGGEPFKKEIIISGFPGTPSFNVMQQAYLGQAQSSDGANVYQDNFLLPADLVNPMDVYRQELNAQTLCTMTVATQGLPRYYDPNVYDWRESNGLYFYPARTAQNFLIRYQAQWPDLDLSDPASRAPIVRCENCLSARIAYEYASTRGGEGAAAMMQLAEEEFGLILQRTNRRENRKNPRRQPYGGYRNGFSAWNGFYLS